MANYYFKNFTSTFPNSAQREDADFMAAYANYMMSPGFRLEQTYTEKAIDDMQLFAKHIPQQPKTKGVQPFDSNETPKLEQKVLDDACFIIICASTKRLPPPLRICSKTFQTANAEQVRHHC